MTRESRPYTDQDVEIAAAALLRRSSVPAESGFHAPTPGEMNAWLADRARAVLDALTADGWVRRDQLAEEIAQAIEAECIDSEWPNDDISANGKTAAAIARQHSTPTNGDDTVSRQPERVPFEGEPPAVKAGDRVEVRDGAGDWHPARAHSEPRYATDPRRSPTKLYLAVAVTFVGPRESLAPVDVFAGDVRPARTEEPTHDV